ncbi:hypothetical protein BCR33DRAFT_765325 [Rhizoclosmatium globosum]|uniref:Uncharacterized protein n=2 Tax=Rhizoclosmatium globosum TaxID=329046 RepID=A0A1Y2CEH5_9FUNG|nr:hypothetical protein BCR33DRAFT_765325 [Rhizoclosmatium globosum]|eukprot:ORY45453.1 hypothetical protein BCR33DRAFT_765325 [Rhizoclosmatium globosum]
MQWRNDAFASFIASVPGPLQPVVGTSFENAVNDYINNFTTNNLHPTADKLQLNISLNAPTHLMKAFIKLLTGKIQNTIQWGDETLLSQLTSDYSCDIDSDITVCDNLEDLLPNGVYKLLPKSNFNFTMKKKVGYTIRQLTGEQDADGNPTFVEKDLGSVDNIMIGEGEKYKLYITYVKQASTVSLNDLQILLWDKGIRPTLQTMLPLTTLQRVTNDSQGRQINVMVGRQGLRFPYVPVEGRYLAGFTDQFKRTLNSVPELKSILGDFKFIGVHQGIKDSFTSEVHLGEPGGAEPIWSDGNPSYKRKKSAVGIATTPRYGFSIVDGAFNVMFESAVPGQGITTLAPIKNFDNLLTSMGFAVEREIMLDCIHIGGLQAHPKEACQYKGVKKIIMYSGFKYQTVDHVDANHGFRSIQVAEIIENTDQFRAKIKAFVNHLSKAEDMSFGMRFEVRGEDAAVASFLQDFKNKIRSFDEKARSTLFVVEKTATLIKYIVIRIQALVSLVSLLGQLIRNHPHLKVYWEETANYIHKELICLVSKPPGWYNSNFDCYTLQKFTSQLHSFGSISYQAFPLLHILAEPNELRYELRNPLPKKLLATLVTATDLAKAVNKKTRSGNNTMGVMHRSLDSGTVQHVLHILANAGSQPKESDILAPANAKTENEQVTRLIDALCEALLASIPNQLIRYPERMQEVKDTKKLTVEHLRKIIDDKNDYPYYVVKSNSVANVRNYEEKLRRFVNFDIADINRLIGTKGTKLSCLAGYFGELVLYLQSFQSIIIFGSHAEGQAAKDRFKTKLLTEARERLEVLPCGDLNPTNTVWTSFSLKNCPGSDGDTMQFLKVFHPKNIGHQYNSKTANLVFMKSKRYK